MGYVVIIIIKIQTNILFCPGHVYVLVVISKQLSHVKFDIQCKTGKMVITLVKTNFYL